jgi:hypothetical protein
MEEVCKYILSNLYNKKSSIKFIKMDIQDLLFIGNNKYIEDKLIKYLKPFSFEYGINKKSFKIIEYDKKEFDIIPYNNYWMITLYPIDD